ncbi:hypothetical protein Tco_0891506 [Tanacetum coccineum]|uniref:Uncharacterized protein n=1 Tax=Tanacetum coccineum TaxID=301880 RepID=A0ABQ5C8K5_9ASTR
MHENKSFNRNPANHALYHALMEALIDDENAMDKGVSYTGKKTKRRRTKELESSKKTSTTKEISKGKASTKSSKTGKSASAKEPVKELIIEVVMDDAVHTASEDVVRDDEQPQDTSEPKTNKTPNQDWFKQPPRPPTPCLEWKKRQVVLDQPEQSWFNQMVLATNGPLTFNDLMATLIEFSKYTNLIGTIQKDIVTPFDLSKPLPLQGRPGYLTVVVDYFFNNDMEYMKTFDPKKTYTTSITKTKTTQYKIVGIEDMVPTLWSTIKHAYDKDAAKGINVKSVSVKKLHGYGYLEDIVVKRADRQLYKFKKGDFVHLHLNDIEDMLLLAVQHKLFHLNESDIVDLSGVSDEVMVSIEGVEELKRIVKNKRKWDGYEIADHDQEEREYENEHEDEERYELFDDHELPVCTVRKFEMIKYSFRQDKEYVGIKEDEYEDLTKTSKEAIHAYQEIFRMMDEGWMVTRAE